MGFVIVNRGAAYFFRPPEPETWSFIADRVSGHWFDTVNQLEILASHDSLYAVALNGRVAWQRRHVAIDGIEVDALLDGVLLGHGCYDPPDKWVPFAIRCSDGGDA
jgi:hypothetical protein